jgi:general secretion pathway protein H
MPISAPGSSRVRPGRAGGGFTLIELLVVLAIIALSVGVVGLSLRDGSESKLEEEGERLSALLEMARAEARVSGVAVRWLPTTGADGRTTGFRFIGLPATQPMPEHWLDPNTSAQVIGSTSIELGPDAILPPQRLLLRLADRRLELGTDGIAPFAPLAQAATP